MKISKVQKDSQVNKVFFQFRDLGAKKLLIKCWKNQSGESISTTFYEAAYAPIFF